MVIVFNFFPPKILGIKFLSYRATINSPDELFLVSLSSQSQNSYFGRAFKLTEKKNLNTELWPTEIQCKNTSMRQAILLVTFFPSVFQFFSLESVSGDSVSFHEFDVSGVTYEPKGQV